MPRVNGLEALRQIKAECPATTVIIVTVHGDDAYRQAAAEGGADAFLLKKTLVTVLLPTIQRLRGFRAFEACFPSCAGGHADTGVGSKGKTPERSPTPRRLPESAAHATRPSAGAHRLVLWPPLARASRVPQVTLAGSTFTTTLPRHRTPSCASGGASRLVGSQEGTRGSRTARGHEMPGRLLHFYEVGFPIVIA